MVPLEVLLPSGKPGNIAKLLDPVSLPVVEGQVPLSSMAWRADDRAYGRWIERTHFPEIPWTISFEGKREAQRRRQFALATGERAGSLTERSKEVIRDAVRWCFSDAAWCLLLGRLRAERLRVSGVVNGLRLEIDDLLLSQLLVDLEHDTATTRDGRQTWHALAVVSPPADDAECAATPARTLLSEFGKWYTGTYPAGHPVGKKHEELAYEAAQSLGRKVSGRTVRRALRDFRRPSAAR